MYAVVATGGKQLKVAEGETIAVEKLDAEVGATVDFDVLFIADGDKVIADPKKLAKAKVMGEIVDHFKGDKVMIFKFKKRKGYKRTRGHRQPLTHVLVKEVRQG